VSRAGQRGLWLEVSRLAVRSVGLPRFLRRPLLGPPAAQGAGHAGNPGHPSNTAAAGLAAETSPSAAAHTAAAALPATIAAVSDVAARLRRREAAFLDVMEHLVYSVPRSPWRRLLQWAGCEAGDLRRMVTADGVEAALSRLREAGVRATAEELRGQAPIRRSGLELAVTAADFDNPLGGGRLAGATSGSTGRPLPVAYSWDFLAAEAADELLLFASHGLLVAPLAFWLPGPPGIAGLHNLLVHAKLGRPPRRWFSPSPPPARGDGLAFWVDRGWRLARRLQPRLGPAPEWVAAESAVDVARWLAGSRRPAVLKCFAGAALRVACAAAAAGLDLSAAVVFAGGEPLTAARQEYLAGAGLRTYARYAATETGFVAGACPRGRAGDDMHLYAARLAVIAGGADEAAPGWNSADVANASHPAGTADSSGALAFTSLSLAAPKVLLNAELGDHGTLRRQPCDCALGRAGLEWRVSGVHSPAKIAAEGVQLGEVDFTRLVEGAVRDLGGSPDDFQIWLDDGPRGTPPAIALAPRSPLAPGALVERLRERLPALSGGALAARLWLDTGALTVERRPLQTGPGGKIRRVIRQAAPAEPDDAP
jgi:hypothetical protein